MIARLLVLVAVLAAFGLTGSAHAAPHDLAVSSSRVVVDGHDVDVALRCPVHALAQVVPLDRDGDGAVSQAEVDAAREPLVAYLLARYRLFAVTATDATAAAAGSAIAIPGRFVRASVTRGETRPGLGAEDVVDVVLRHEAAEDLRALRIESDVLREIDPFHRDHATLRWNGTEVGARVLWIEDPAWTFVPSEAPRGVVRAYVELGIEHILTGYDHVAFVLALLVASRRMRSIVGVATAFTLAHSITLAASALGWIVVSGRVVEPLIAASIAFVAVRNLVARSERVPWPEAFGFGLVHGLGFAGSIAETLAAEPQKIGALLGFNLGVEVGQLGVIALALLVLVPLRRVFARPAEASARDVAPTLTPRPVRIAVSIAVAALGAWWCVERLVSAV